MHRRNSMIHLTPEQLAGRTLPSKLPMSSQIWVWLTWQGSRGTSSEHGYEPHVKSSSYHGHRHHHHHSHNNIRPACWRGLDGTKLLGQMATMTSLQSCDDSSENSCTGSLLRFATSARLSTFKLEWLLVLPLLKHGDVTPPLVHVESTIRTQGQTHFEQQGRTWPGKKQTGAGKSKQVLLKAKARVTLPMNVDLSTHSTKRG